MESHYKYSFDETTSTYNFTTTNNIFYKVAFVIDHTFSSIANQQISKVFQLVIEKVNIEIEPFDIKVSKTIEVIIESFFINVENSLVFLCYDQNNKGKLRYEVFERWYNKSVAKQNITKINKIFEFNIDKNEVQKFYTAFIFHNKNPNYVMLISIYNSIADVLNTVKEQ